MTSTSKQPAASAANAFAFDLFAHVDTQGNQCISPYSALAALTMVSSGAQGDTRTQMLATLHWDGPADDLPAAVKSLTAALTTAQPGLTVDIANSIWSSPHLVLQPAFTTALRDQSAAEMRITDFAKHPDTAASDINQWGARHTHDRITQCCPRDSITAATRMILVNATYFKGDWQEQFHKSRTTPLPFHSTGADVNVPTMSSFTHYDYAETDDLQVLRLPYKGGYSMVVFLPRSATGLAALRSSLTRERCSALLRQTKKFRVDLTLPKFTMQLNYSLNNMLAQQGMPLAFSDAADFSGITRTDPLKIDKVLQSTFIAVDETGTEAAAVTSVHMAYTAVAPRPEPTKVFHADHPFVYLVQHDASQTILFIGQVTAPE